MRVIFLLCFLTFSTLICPSGLNAQNVSKTVIKRNPAFNTPKGLQPRVNFWINIFTRYGEHHEVLHHRAYPQAVFKVLNFYSAAQKLNPVALENFKKKEIKKHVALVRTAVKNLATGATPKTDLEKIIAKEMAFLGSGTNKYKELLGEDMIRSQRGIKERYREAVERAGLYMPHIEKIFVQEAKLPVELTRLPFVESSFQYEARSAVGAAGIWQFMPATARSHNLMVNSIIDERLDVIEATRAAAKYLAHAYKVLESWPLAVTSYNHGIVGVARKVKQLGTRDITQVVEHRTQRLLGFASNNFYPELLAAITVYENKTHYFPNLKVNSPLSFSEYKLSSPASIEYITNRLHITKHDLMPLNYALLSPIWSGRYRIPKGYNLKIPVTSNTFVTNLKTPEPISPAASSVYAGLTYKVRKGDTLISLAKKYNVTVKYLMQANNLTSSNLRIGQSLIVKGNVAQATKTAPKNVNVQQRRIVVPTTAKVYTVRKGDTLSKIAKNQGTTVDNIKRLNGLRSNTIKIGQKLKVSAGVTPTAKNNNQVGKTYIVRNGDSLWSIAKKFGTSVNSIKQKNNIKGNNLKVGMKLRVS